jgi:uncharacterized protein YbbC (DUF1343 family)
MGTVTTGLQELIEVTDIQKKIKGNIAYLCHGASITKDFQIGIIALKKIFGERFIKIFGPQHGFVGDVQDNMVETNHYHHPYFNLPVYSLYSETRSPTEEMLAGVDTIIVDLQDVGVRVYTYISTLMLLMKECAKTGTHVFVLDRPNPIGGKLVEGVILEDAYKSFVGITNIPQRHGMTMGEVAVFMKKHEKIDCKLSIVPMKGWHREMMFSETGLPWVNPSPNLPTADGAYCFPGTVLFEGTNISEGRGTTRSLEIIGHPKIEPFSLLDKLNPVIKAWKLTGFVLRPIIFRPTFQKHQGISCGGFQIQVTHPKIFHAWKLGQLLMHELYIHLGEDFKWKSEPYEYVYDKLAIDVINGTEKLRHWVEKSGSSHDLFELEKEGQKAFLEFRKEILIYH